MATKQPFVSISIPCWNGEFLLGPTLTSLINQTYPADRYEIIVVDNGSTDNTPAVCAKFPNVKYIRLDKNYGISVGRNTGLEEAQGEIYVAFDCDCRAHPEWLTNLVSGFADGKAIGVGAKLVEPQPITRIATRYISMCDTLFAPPTSVVSDTPRRAYHRLFDYVMLRVRTPKPDTRKLREVSELYGASSSFLREVLESVGGWDVSLSGIEDRDISQRLRAAYPGRPFYIVPAATVEHERGESLWQYLKRPVRRGIVNFNFHRSNKLAPPLFPFPFLYVAVLLGSIFVSPVATLIFAIFGPQVLYFWWPIKFVQRHHLVLIIFPYIQMLEEIMVIIGLARGLIALLKVRWRHVQISQ